MIFTTIRRSAPLRSTPLDRQITSNTLPPMQEAPIKPFSRITGYSNAVDAEQDSSNGLPPSYDIAESYLCRSKSSPPSYSSSIEEGNESLPNYSCSVHMEGPLIMKLERTTPFDSLNNTQWKDVYCILNGTILSFHHMKSNNIFGKASKSENKNGRLIRSYSLQHAEVGVAADHKKVELVPRVHFAQLLPQSTLHHLQESDPHLFESVRLYIARLRLENVQLLLRFPSSDSRTEWIDKICQAIDISPPLEDRADPKYHTLPRRRRRNRGRGRSEDPLTEMMFMLSGRDFRTRQLDDPQTSTYGETPANPGDENLDDRNDGVEDALSSSVPFDPEAEDLDRTFLVQEPARTTNEPLDNANSSRLPINGSIPIDVTFLWSGGFDSSQTDSPGRSFEDQDRKSQPRPLMSPVQEARYRRRCMPNLLFHSRRASDYIFQDGKRWKIDWSSNKLRTYRDKNYDSRHNWVPHNSSLILDRSSDSSNETASSLRLPSAELPAYDSADMIELCRGDSNGDTSTLQLGDKDHISWSRRIKNFALPKSNNGVDAVTTGNFASTISVNRHGNVQSQSVVSF